MLAVMSFRNSGLSKFRSAFARTRSIEMKFFRVSTNAEKA
jgi:hypothetical protein